MSGVKDVAGSVVIVTGGGRGIGRSTCELFLQRGARVAVCDIDELSATRTADELGERATAYALDVCDESAFRDVVARVEADMGPVDVLVNNAGIMPLGAFLDQPLARDRKQIDINLFGVIHGMRAVLPGMLKRERGHVVNIASVAGRIGVPGSAVYSASKFGVIGVTEAVRLEHYETEVGFSYVMPALVDTELISGTGRPTFPPPVTPEAVAKGVLRAVETGKVDVFVPRMARLSVIVPALFPRSLYERVGKFFNLDGMFQHVDDSAREAYRERIAT